jgi:folate-dependent phosphoribosylglycinamide formyltransferase PurN
VLAGDTAVSLAERVYREELTAYPQAIAMMLERITRTQAAAGAWR